MRIFSFIYEKLFFYSFTIEKVLVLSSRKIKKRFYYIILILKKVSKETSFGSKFNNK